MAAPKPIKIGDPAQFTPDPPAAKPPGKVGAFARGFAQEATLGFADEIAGLVGGALTGQTVKEAIAESRRRFKAAEEAEPLAFGAGGVGGALATLAVPGLGVARGTKLAAQAGRAGKAAIAAKEVAPTVAQVAGRSGLVGGVSALGKTEAETKARGALDVGVGTLTGAVLGGALAGAGRLISQAPARKEALDFAGLKEQGIQTSTKVRLFGNKGQKEAAVKTALRSEPEIKNAALAGDIPAAIQRVDAKLGELDDRLTGFYKAAEDVFPGRGVPTANVTREVRKVADEWDTEATASIAKGMRRAADNLERRFPDDVPLQSLRQEYRAFQDKGFTGLPMFNVPVAKAASQDTGNALRKALRDEMEFRLKADRSIGDIDDFKAVNREFGTWLDINKALLEKTARQQAGAPPLRQILERPVAAALAATGKAATEPADRFILAPVVGAAQAGRAIPARAARTAMKGAQQVAAVKAPDVPGALVRAIRESQEAEDEDELAGFQPAGR